MIATKEPQGATSSEPSKAITKGAISKKAAPARKASLAREGGSRC